MNNTTLTQVLSGIVAATSSSEFSSFVTQACLHIEQDNVDLRTLGHQKRLHTFAHIFGFENWNQLKAELTRNEFIQELQTMYLTEEQINKAWEETKQLAAKEKTPNGKSLAQQYCEQNNINKPNQQFIGRIRRAPMYFKDKKGVIWTANLNGETNYPTPIVVRHFGELLGLPSAVVELTDIHTGEKASYVLASSLDALSAQELPEFKLLDFGQRNRLKPYQQEAIAKALDESGFIDPEIKKAIESNPSKLDLNTRMEIAKKSVEGAETVGIIGFEAKLQAEVDKNRQLMSAQLSFTNGDILCQLIDKGYHGIGQPESTPRIYQEIEQFCIEQLGDSPDAKAKIYKSTQAEIITMIEEAGLLDDLFEFHLSSYEIDSELYDYELKSHKKMSDIISKLAKRGHVVIMDTHETIRFKYTSTDHAAQELIEAISAKKGDSTVLGNILKKNGFCIQIDKGNEVSAYAE